MADSLVIEQYLTKIRDIHGTGAHVPETSFYPALEHLLSDIGKNLSPKVHCIINPANRGAGIPDGALFSADQFRGKLDDAETKDSFLVQNPSRGVIEAKPINEDIKTIVKTEQVERYWKKYGMVLVTNFRAFTLIGKSPDGKQSILESFSIAETETAFWRLAEHPHKTASELGGLLFEYLKRVLLHNAPLTAPQDVAAILASYARDARLRIVDIELPAMVSLQQALEDALGLHFKEKKGEHFFRSTLIQTLFYGIFSAWVLWARKQNIGSNQNDAPASNFDWKLAYWLLRVPMLRALFVQVADPDRLGTLGLIEVLNWTAAALNRVDHVEFFKSFDEGHAIQYFYEPFLQAFDPDLRKELGVWYTPEEIVRYQVERIDTVLRQEMKLADGLADPNVIILDPCCGTGTYLRAVIRRIATTLKDKGSDALFANDLKKAATERIFGFEILPAPFVIAHLQLGLELETLGAPLSNTDSSERVGVYLTNALTGWDSQKQYKQIAFPGFDEERDAARKVKQEKAILVILGNPPYNAFAGVSSEEENNIVETYKKGLTSDWGIKKYNLDDLYIRFFRLAEKCIAEHGGRGIVSFISNYSYLSGPSFVVMRQSLLSNFDKFWFDCLNGDSRETGKITPDGKPDPSIFSTEYNKVGIQTGTAIGLMVRKDERNEKEILFRHFWGGTKKTELIDSLNNLDSDFNNDYMISNPRVDNRLSLRPLEVPSTYLEWPKISELCVVKSDGLLEKRNGALIDIDRSKLESRMKVYFDASMEWEQLNASGHKLTKNAARFNAKDARIKVLNRERYDASRTLRYTVRPFDVRWCYYSLIRPLWNEPRPTLWKHTFPGNKWVVSRLKTSKTIGGSPILFLTTTLLDGQVISVNPSAIPMRLSVTLNDQDLTGLEYTANLSPGSRSYLLSLGFSDIDTDQQVTELIWYHAIAIGYSPAYLTENADGIQQDWPRIVLPNSKELLIASAVLGQQVATLLDTEVPVPGVTTGKIQDDLQPIAVFQRIDGKPAKPEDGDLDVTAGWGHVGKSGITMPGRGKLIHRDNESYDVYMNKDACWRNVPEPVWNYSIGGYQVIKKWLSYREKSLLGRGLIPDEVRYVTEVVRRLASLIVLQPQLDINYKQMKSFTYNWQHK